MEEAALLVVVAPPVVAPPAREDASALASVMTTASNNAIRTVVCDVEAASQMYAGRKRRPPGDVGGAEAQRVGALGMLKEGWFEKHRNRRPSLAMFVASADAVAAEPATWAQLCAQVDAVRMATNRRSAPMLIAVVGNTPVPNERIAALRRRADLDERSVVVVPTLAVPGAANALVAPATELCLGFYRDEARRRKANLTSLTSELAQRGAPLPAPVAVRAHLKLGFFNEVVADALTAGKHYALAYGFVKQLVHELGANNAATRATGDPDASAAAFAMALEECRAVASVLFDKLCMMHTALPHITPGDPGGELRRLIDGHVRFFRKPGERFASIPRVLIARHAAWSARQCERGARALLATSANHAECRFAAARLYNAAASHAWHRRRCYVSAREAGLCPAPATQQTHASLMLGVGVGPYVGTFVSADGSRIGWDEFLAYTSALEGSAENGAVQSSTDENGDAMAPAGTPAAAESDSTHSLVNEMLHAAYALYDAQSCGRYRAMVAVAYAQEQELHGTGAEALAEAQRLLERALPLFRRDRAHAPLGEALAAYRGVLGKQGKRAEHAAASLELCALSSAMDPGQRAAVQASTFAALGERAAGEDSDAEDVVMDVTPSSADGAGSHLRAPGALIVRGSWNANCFNANIKSCLPLPLKVRRVTLEAAVPAADGAAASVVTAETGACELSPGSPMALTFDVPGDGDGARPIRIVLESAETRVRFEHAWRTESGTTSGVRFPPEYVLATPNADDSAPMRATARAQKSNEEGTRAASATPEPPAEQQAKQAQEQPAEADGGLSAPLAAMTMSDPAHATANAPHAQLRLELPEEMPLRGAPFTVSLCVSAPQSAPACMRVEVGKAHPQSVWAGARGRTLVVAAGTEARLTWTVLCCQAGDDMSIGSLSVRSDSSAASVEVPVLLCVR